MGNGKNYFTMIWHKKFIDRLDWRIFRRMEAFEHGCYMARRYWG